MELKEALSEIRKGKSRKFEQSVDLIINLKSIDVKRTGFNIIILLPNIIKEKKVCGFLKEKSSLVKSIGEPEFKKYGEKGALRKLVNEYDYFIASAELMPKVASNFGRILGPTGKMPSPQLGILMKGTDEEIRENLDKISRSLKIRLKEASIKVMAGKEKMDDEKIIQNIKAIYEPIVNGLPKKNENIKNVMIKLSMGKPIKVEIK